jgi:hypothetical protein
MTKKLTTNQKVINLIKKAYFMANNDLCNFDCGNCEFKKFKGLDRKNNEHKFGLNSCPQVQFKWAMRHLLGDGYVVEK